MFEYPVYASDYLDMGHSGGRGSMGGILSSDHKILIGYKAGMTFETAEKVANLINEKRPEPKEDFVDVVHGWLKTLSKGGQS